MKISAQVGRETWNNLEHFRYVAVYPLNPGYIFLFSECVFVNNIIENGWTDFHKIVRICQARHKKELARLFHASLDCFTLSHLGAPMCLLATFQ